MGLRLIPYESPDEALEQYNLLPLSSKVDMARVYQEAFGGKPWFEKCACAACQTFEKDTVCSRCGATDLPPAYPTGDLVYREFPAMLSSFAPGVLVLAQSPDGAMVGFCTGGMTTPDILTELKYKGNAEVGNSLKVQTGLRSDEEFFYENEMCVVPELQGIGIGSRMNKARLDWIRSRGIGTVLGRTINPNLLKMKATQFPASGFDMRVFTPDGDTYSVDGLQRQCYFAVRTR